MPAVFVRAFSRTPIAREAVVIRGKLAPIRSGFNVMDRRPYLPQACRVPLFLHMFILPESDTASLKSVAPTTTNPSPFLNVLTVFYRIKKGFSKARLLLACQIEVAGENTKYTTIRSVAAFDSVAFCASAY